MNTVQKLLKHTKIPGKYLDFHLENHYGLKMQISHKLQVSVFISKLLHGDGFFSFNW